MSQLYLNEYFFPYIWSITKCFNMRYIYYYERETNQGIHYVPIWLSYCSVMGIKLLLTIIAHANWFKKYWEWYFNTDSSLLICVTFIIKQAYNVPKFGIFNKHYDDKKRCSWGKKNWSKSHLIAIYRDV